MELLAIVIDYNNALSSNKAYKQWLYSRLTNGGGYSLKRELNY